MKFALVNTEKVEATQGIRGACPSCGSEVFAKCGNLRINHWAHKGERNCDSWWENETEWHRLWKGAFPSSWQEIVQFADSGEKHIADVKTESGWVLEFQHSYIVSNEREARNAFYAKLVWVVDATRRKTDQRQFQRILSDSSAIVPKYDIRKVSFPEECRLLSEWKSNTSLVFFDFGNSEDKYLSRLWLLFPSLGDGSAYIAPFARDGFLELHRENKFDKFYEEVIVPMMSLLREYRQGRMTRIQPSLELVSGNIRHRFSRRRFRF
jgi:competence protein CoiA